MCPTPLRKTSFARGDVAASAQALSIAIGDALVSATERRNRLRIWQFTDRIYFLEEAGMNRSDDLRKNAENCVALAEATHSDPKKKRYARMATAWNSLADTQAWLDGEMEKKSTSSVGQHEA